MKFRGVQFLEWADEIAMVAFIVSAGIFLFFLIGALRTSRARIEHDASLPLKEDDLA